MGTFVGLLRKLKKNTTFFFFALRSLKKTKEEEKASFSKLDEDNVVFLKLREEKESDPFFQPTKTPDKDLLKYLFLFIFKLRKKKHVF